MNELTRDSVVDVGQSVRHQIGRQARRTQLHDGTTTVLIILDALAPLTDQQLNAAADELLTHLDEPDLLVARRLLPATPA